MAASSKRAAQETEREITSLKEIRQARIREKRDLDDSIASLQRAAAARRKEADEASRSLEALKRQADIEKKTAAEREKQSIEEVRSMRARASEMAAFTENMDKETRQQIAQLRKEAQAFDDLAKEEAASNRRRAAETDLLIAKRQESVRDLSRQATVAEQSFSRQERASRGLGTEIRGLERDINRLAKTQDDHARSSGRMRSALSSLGREAGFAQNGVRGLNSEFQGFQVALFIKYIQSIITAVVALGAQLVAVASAAVQAGAGIAGALAAGAAQAVPVIGVLAAALFRVKNVLQAVKQQNNEQLTATKNATIAARAQRTAAEQVAAAQQQVADAHRTTAQAIADAQRQEVQAQRDVTQARKDAIRTVQDLIDAEKRSQLSVEDAQAALRRAQQTGDVAGVASAQLGLQEAQTGRTRAQQDVARLGGRGAEGVQTVIDAERRLADVRLQNARQIADAHRQEQRAEQNLNRVRRDSAATLAQETTQASKLKDMLAQLDPAERQLYRRILALQATYRRVARPITDILTRAFTGVVDTINQKLQDPRILRGFRNIATAIAGSIRTATREATGRRSTGVFEILSAEAARNIPIATRILVNFFRALRNLVVDALPAFRLLLRYVEGYSRQALDASRNSRGIRDFFVTGVRYANSFFKLGLAVVRLFLAIGGRGGAAGEGIRTIDYLTGVVDGLTRKIDDNAGAVRRFFRQTGGVLHDVLRVIGAIGLLLIKSFHPQSVKAFADFMIDVIIPALGNVIGILGVLVNAFHQLATLPGFNQIAQFAATVLLLGKGLTVISEAVQSVTSILPAMLAQFGALDAEAAAGGGFLAAITPGGWIILGLLALVAAVVLLDKKFHFLGPTFRWLKGVAEDVFGAIKKVGASVLSWMSDVWTQGLLYWIRWPFMKLGQLVPWDAIGKAITGAFRTVINFFTHKQRGGWATLQDILLAPFRFFGRYLGLILSFALLPVRVFLDILAGRFGDAFNAIKSVFVDLIDTVVGGFTTFLGVLKTVLSLLGRIPRFGEPFKIAAGAVGDAQGSLDKWRKSLRDSTKEQDDSNDKVKTARKRYQDAKDQLQLLTPGTTAYKDQVKVAKARQDDLNEALRITRGRARDAQQPVGTLGTNIAGLGTVAYDTARNVQHNLNALLKNVGARTIAINTRLYKSSGINQMTAVTGHAATGGRLSSSGLRRFYAGGIPNPYGGAADDHLVLSPSGMPIAAFSGTEGILNTPQMGAVDMALGFSKAMGALPWGSLGELWGSGLRHYATGGGLQPAIRGLSNRLDRQFGLVTTSGYRTSMPMGHPDYHNVGLAADISGSPQAMDRAVRFIRNSGLWRGLVEGIHNPGLSVKNGQMVPPSFWGASTWAAHANHIHLALRSLVGGIGALVDRVRQPQFTGLRGSGVLGDIAVGGARRLTRAANAYLARVMAAQGGGDVQAMGADANVVAAFRRAMRDMRANRIERLAGWEAGIVESGLRNLHYGDADSLGALQERASIFGRAHALNPYASMVRFLRDAESRRPWRGTAGMLAAAVQRPAAQFRGRYDAVRGQAMRYMQRGGLVGGLSPRPFSVPRSPGSGPLFGLGALPGLLSDVADALRGFTAARLRRVKDIGKKIRAGFEKLTEDGGVFDQMNDAIEAIATRGATRLQELQFRIGRGGRIQRRYRSPAQQAQDQLGILGAQRTGLLDEQTSLESGIVAAQRALHEAQRRHNRRAAAQARAAITNLRNRLDKNRADLAQNAQDQVEAQESFQQALVDAVNNQAQAQMSHLDRLQRLAGLGGQTNYGAIGGILAQRGGVIRTQIAGLQGALAQAQRSGNVDLVNNLRDQIDELNTQLAENTQAIRDNTDEAFNARTQQIQNRASFATGIFGNIQQFFQALGTSTGADTTAQQRTALQATGGALAAAQSGLKGQLASLLGYSPQEAARLQNLSGGDLVSFVQSIASGPAFESIMARLDPTQQQSFQDLLSALVDNATATQQNTDALTSLTGATTGQSFTSSFWSAFRIAIFNGAGGLLPQYQMTIPGADVGARVLASGALMVHAGENVRPAVVARDWQGRDGGDTYNVNVTTPTEVLNPTDVGRQLAHYRKVAGR